jgi:hypothetical protein
MTFAAPSFHSEDVNISTAGSDAFGSPPRIAARVALCSIAAPGAGRDILLDAFSPENALPEFS